MKKYSKADQRALATWAAHCARHVLPMFEKAYPTDDRPRQAIEACRTWVRTGVFKMAEIRRASLSAHAAARAARSNGPACFAARAAGHSVATAHVPQHAMGSAYYALKAVAAAKMQAGAAPVAAAVARERAWQARRLAPHLRAILLERIVVENRNDAICIKIKKGKDF